MIAIRFRLTDYLKKFGGHIGDSVAPSERRKGYITQMLGMALQLLKKSGVATVWITCLQGNEGSRKPILNHGGVYESTVYEPDKKVNVERYWIDLSC